jgi:hypothetical protein
MTTPPRYAAFWVPGLDQDFDPDDALLVAFDWLRAAEREHGGAGVLVMNAASMRGNRPLLGSAPWDIVSRRTRRPRGTGPVLAVWPTAQTLDFAEHLAIGTALCVVPGTLSDMAPWIRRTNAVSLVQGFDVQKSPSLSTEITESLDHMLFFGGHNHFLGGGEKEDAIGRLKLIARRADAPSRGEIEGYLRSTGRTDSSGAERAGKWYEEIQQGKRHRDDRGRTI